jgi:hypothetical protein
MGEVELDRGCSEQRTRHLAASAAPGDDKRHERQTFKEVARRDETGHPRSEPPGRNEVRWQLYHERFRSFVRPAVGK